MLATVISSTKAESKQNQQMKSMQQQISDLQVSGGIDNDGKANTSSVTTGKAVTFDQALFSKLETIVGKAKGKRK